MDMVLRIYLVEGGREEEGAAVRLNIVPQRGLSHKQANTGVDLMRRNALEEMGLNRRICVVQTSQS